MKAILALLAAGLLVACKPPPPPVAKEVEISGQVFITLKNRNTLKLSLTPVVIVAETNGLKHIERVSADHRALRTAALAKVDRARTNLAAAAEAWRPHREELDKLKREAERLNGIMAKNVEVLERGTTLAQSQAALKVGAEILGRVRDLASQSKIYAAAHAAEQQAKTDADAALEAANQELLALPKLATRLFGQPFPDSISGVITDADGKFRFRVPAGGRYLLIAETKRPVPSITEEGKEEVYRWVVNTVAGAGGDVNLHNENLFSEP